MRAVTQRCPLLGGLRTAGGRGVGWTGLGTSGFEVLAWGEDRSTAHRRPRAAPSGKADSWVIRDSFSSGRGALFTCCLGGPAPLHRLRCGLGPDPPGGEEGQASRRLPWPAGSGKGLVL